MSINTAHTTNGVLLHAMEYLMLYIDCMRLEFVGEKLVPLYGVKFGRLYITSHRLIFMNNQESNMLQSVSFPYVAMSDVVLFRPKLLDISYIEGKLQPQVDGHIHNELTFRIRLTEGGDEVLLEFINFCIKSAADNLKYLELDDSLPPYTPIVHWFELPPVAYEPPPPILEMLPKHPIFTEPQPNTIYGCNAKAPYVGILDPYYKEPKPRECRMWPKCCCPPPEAVPKQRDFGAQVREQPNARLTGGIDLLREPVYGCNNGNPMEEYPNLLLAGNAVQFTEAYKAFDITPTPSVYLFRPPHADSNFFKHKTPPQKSEQRRVIDDDDMYNIEVGDVLVKTPKKPKA